MKHLHLLPLLIAACFMAPRAHAATTAAIPHPAPAGAPRPGSGSLLLTGLAAMLLVSRGSRNEAFNPRP